jgi:hypothetical protein
MTKNELNARLPIPLSASVLKKISLADLQARVDALPTGQVLDDSEQLTPTRKPRVVADGVLFPALAERKEPKAGTKKALILDLLRTPNGTTFEDIAAATGWSRSVASSAVYGDVKATGHGVARIDGRLYLLPREGQ